MQWRSQGWGSWGARDPPFVSLFVSKQPTIFRRQFDEYPLYESVGPPPALKNPSYAHGMSTNGQFT